MNLQLSCWILETASILPTVYSTSAVCLFHPLSFGIVGSNFCPSVFFLACVSVHSRKFGVDLTSELKSSLHGRNLNIFLLFRTGRDAQGVPLLHTARQLFGCILPEVLVNPSSLLLFLVLSSFSLLFVYF